MAEDREDAKGPLPMLDLDEEQSVDMREPALKQVVEKQALHDQNLQKISRELQAAQDGTGENLEVRRRSLVVSMEAHLLQQNALEEIADLTEVGERSGVEARDISSSSGAPAVILDQGMVANCVASVWLDWRNLQFCPLEIRSNRDTVLTAVKRSAGEAFEFAAPELKQDKDVVLEAVRENGLTLQYAAPEVRADRAFVLQAVQIRGEALKYASAELRADREVVTAAVRQNGSALVYASEDLLADFSLLLEATNEDVRANRAAVDECLANSKARKASLKTASREIAIEEESRQQRFAVQQKMFHEEPKPQNDYDDLLESFKKVGSELHDMQADHDKRMQKFAYLDFF